MRALKMPSAEYLLKLFFILFSIKDIFAFYNQLIIVILRQYCSLDADVNHEQEKQKNR